MGFFSCGLLWRVFKIRFPLISFLVPPFDFIFEETRIFTDRTGLRLSHSAGLHGAAPLAEPQEVQLYSVAHEKPARRLVDKRGRRSRTLYRKLNKCKCKVLTG